MVVIGSPPCVCHLSVSPSSIGNMAQQGFNAATNMAQKGADLATNALGSIGGRADLRLEDRNACGPGERCGPTSE